MLTSNMGLPQSCCAPQVQNMRGTSQTGAELLKRRGLGR